MTCKTCRREKTMTRRSLTVAVFCLMFCAATPAAGPSPANALEGRIAYSADGNHNDPDDWPAFRPG